MHEMRAVFNDLKDGKYLISIKDVRKRSVQQNRYYWGVVVPIIRKGLYDSGFDAVRTNNDAHEVIKQVLLKKQIVNKQTGEVIDMAGSTQELSIPEFNDFIESICRWASEYLGVVIPSPYEQLAEFKDWQEYVTDEAEA
jgi:hypothetical protein